MKAVSNYHPGYQNDFSEYGATIYEVDESEPYEEDEAALIEQDGLYTLIQATGCSCWDGDWEGWTDLTLDELVKVAHSWTTGYGAEKVMGQYILENYSDDEEA